MDGLTPRSIWIAQMRCFGLLKTENNNTKNKFCWSMEFWENLEKGNGNILKFEVFNSGHWVGTSNNIIL